MALRIIVTTTDAAANVGGPVHVTHKTFDVQAPEVEAFMAEKMGSLEYRCIVGVEVIPQEKVDG